MDQIIQLAVTTALVVALVVAYTILTRAWIKKPTHDGKPSSGKTLACRISNIPTSVSKKEFEEALRFSGANLRDCETSRSSAALIKWSYARSGHSPQFCVATATFSASPPPDVLEAEIKRRLHLESTDLRVDLNFFGLTPVADPEGATIDIVAVTGLAGHAFGSWKLRKETHMWLRDFLPLSVPDARIFVYGYDTKLPGSESTASILDLSKRFLESLKTVRGATERYRPMLFIGHSLGGLVVKQALVNAFRGSTDDKDVFMACYALVLFGVPNRGLENAGLRSMVRGQPNEDLVRDLSIGSSFLELLHQGFYDTFHNDSRVLSIFETKQTRTVEWSTKSGTWERSGPRVLMVPPSSAIHAAKNEEAHDQFSIDADHSDIVKFHSSQPEYQIVASRIKQLAGEAQAVISRRVIHHEKTLSQAERQFLEVLRAPNYVKFRNERVEEAAAGTLQWVLLHELVESWLSSPCSSFLWIRGTPGQGKTVLSKFLINHVESELKKSHQRTCLLYFFFYDQDEGFTSMGSLLRSFIKQLLAFTQVRHHIVDLIDRGLSEKVDDDLWGVLSDILRASDFGTIYCIVDALDECNDEEPRKMFLHRLKRLFTPLETERCSILKLVVTSRPTVDIGRQLRDIPCLELTAKEEDLRIMIGSKISALRDFDDELRTDITTMLLDGAGRTFLWIAIVLRKLEELTWPNRAKVQEIIADTPRDLDKLYRSIFDRIMDGPEDEQKLLVWVVYAQRPLSLKELEAALATQRSSATEASTKPYRTKLGREEALRSTVGVFLEITVDDKVVLFHQSAKDFLLQTGQLGEARFLNTLPPEVYLVEVCIVYLAFEDFQTGPCNDHRALEERKSRYPFFQYAANHWHLHVKSLDSAKKISSMIQRIIQPSSPILLSWAEAARITDMQSATDTWDIASKANIAWLVDIESSAMSTVTEYRVHQAATSVAGYKIIENLLRRTDTHFTDSAVLAVAEKFDEGTMRLLVERKEFQMIPDLLLAAARNTHSILSVMRVLLDQTGQITLTDRLVELTGRHTFSGPSMEMLLRRPNVCITDGAIVALARFHTSDTCRLIPEGRTITIDPPLLDAAIHNTYQNHNPIIMALLSGDVRVDLTEGTILIMVVHFKHEVIATLLDHATNKAKITESILKSILKARLDKRTIRLFLEMGEHTSSIIKKIMWMLVDASTDFNMYLGFWDKNLPRIEDGSALFEASSLGDEGIVHILLEYGTDIKARSKALPAAAFSGNHIIMKMLLDQGMDSNGLDRALQVAAYSGSNDTVEMLLNHGADPNAQDHYGYGSALQAAAYSQKIGIIQMLLDRGADVNAQGARYGNSQWAASYGGSDEIVQMLLDNGVDLNAHSGEFCTVLHAVASISPERWAIKDIEPVIRVLLCNGAKVGCRDNHGRTPMALAAECGQESVTELLIEKGATVDCKDHDGHTPLSRAARRGHVSTVELLIHKGAAVDSRDKDGRTPLLWAAVDGHFSIVELLIHKGAAVDSQDKDGRTPLLWAAAEGYVSTVKLLIHKGAAVDSQDKDGRTPLSWAAAEGNISTVELLINEGAAVDSQDKEGRTPLLWAAVEGYVSTVELLIHKGAAVDSQDKDGRIPLSWAAAEGNISIVKLLINKGAVVDSQDKDGRTPLSWAAVEGYVSTVKLLIHKGAAVDSQDKDGRTPLSWAAAEGNISTVKLLINEGAAVDTQANDGHTPVWWAAENEHNSVMDLLVRYGAASAQTE